MHSDILELYVLYKSAPIIHLGEAKTDNMLSAGRIAAQDALGLEATGENIIMEELETSYIQYLREGDFLIALRCSQTVSRNGARRLLNRIMQRLKESEDLIIEKGAAQHELRALRRDLDLLLGEKLPVNPREMAHAEQIIHEYMEKYPFIDLIGIATPEGWPILINHREASALQHSQFFWRDIVDLLHVQLSEENVRVITQDQKWFHVIHPFSYGEEEEWWAFVARIDAAKSIQFFEAGSELVLSKVLRLIYRKLIPNLERVIIPMIRSELAQIGMEGPLGELIRFIYSLDLPVAQARFQQASGTGIFQMIIQKQRNDIPIEVDVIDILTQLGSAIRALDTEKIAEIMKTPEKSWKVVLDVASSLAFMRFMEEMAIYLAKQGRFDDYSKGRPRPLALGIGDSRGLKSAMDRLLSLINQGVPLELFLELGEEETLDLRASRGIYVSRGLIPLSEYRFAVIDLPIIRVALVLYRDVRGNYSGFLTFNDEFVNVVQNRLLYLKEELHLE